MNHTDRGHPSDCADGAYVCDGGDAFEVGRANLTETAFGPRPSTGARARETRALGALLRGG